MPRFPCPRGPHRGDLARRGGRARPGPSLPRRDHAGSPRAHGLRARRHQPDGVPGLLPGRRRLHQLGQGQRHPGRAWSWLRRGLDRRLRDADHRPRPARARPALRAVPQPRAHLDARLRHRLRRASSRRGDPLRHREVRRRPGLDDRHLRHHQGQAGRQGLLADPRLPVRDGRPDHQGDAGGGHGQGRAAQGDLRQQPQALRRGRRVPGPLRGRRRRQAGRRHRDRHRGPQAAVGRPRRGRDHVERAARGHHPVAQAPRRRRDDHAVRLPHLREPRAHQDGLPGAAQPHRPRRRGAQHRGQPRHRGGPRGPPADRRRDLQAAPTRRHAGCVPARRRPDAGIAALDEARLLRRHLGRGRALPARPDGRRLPQQVCPPQDRPRAGGADPPRAGRGARVRARRDLRAAGLPGAGAEDRPAAGRLHAGCCRPAAQGDGQEEEGDPRRRVPALRGGHEGQRVQPGGREGAVGRAGPVLRLRLQQGPLGRLRPGLLLDGVPQGQLPGRVHGRPPDVRPGRQGQDGDLPQRVPPHEDPGAAARRQRVGRQLHPGRPRHPLRPDRDPQRRQQRRRQDRRGAARPGVATRTSTTSWTRSTRWSATSG